MRLDTDGELACCRFVPFEAHTIWLTTVCQEKVRSLTPFSARFLQHIAEEAYFAEQAAILGTTSRDMMQGVVAKDRGETKKLKQRV